MHLDEYHRRSEGVGRVAYQEVVCRQVFGDGARIDWTRSPRDRPGNSNRD